MIRFFDTASLYETERSLGDALTTYLKGFLYSWEDAEDLMIEAFATQDQNEQRERLIVTDRSFFIFFFDSCEEFRYEKDSVCIAGRLTSRLKDVLWA